MANFDALGLFHENLESMNAAIEYIQKAKGEI